MPQPVEIHVVSDATGETATRVVMAVERQFPELEFQEIRHPRVTNVDEVQLAAVRARGRRAVIVYTLVNPELRDAMRACCKRYRLHYCDLLGHPLEAVARVSGLPAKGEPGALPVLDSSYFKRVEAIEFAVQADDGIAPRRLREADVVLVGVSRTSKTPLSIYLGYLGYKAANVPLVKGIDPPEGLWRGRSGEGRGRHPAGRDARRDPRPARPRHAQLDAGVRQARGRVRGARAGRRRLPAARVPRDRGGDARDRGNGPPDHPARRAPTCGARAAGTPRASPMSTPKSPIPWYWWPWWMFLLALGLVVFYAAFTPVWMAFRGVAWLSERGAAATGVKGRPTGGPFTRRCC